MNKGEKKEDSKLCPHISSLTFNNLIKTCVICCCIQVKSSTGGRATARDAYRSLIATEGYSGLARGLTARITQSSITSSLVILGYEYVKRTSLKDDVQL